MTYARRGGFGVGYDSFRDIGFAHGIASGHPGEDPLIPGLPAWYPPGIPALIAAVGFVTGQDLAFLETTSAYWLGVLLPIAIFLVVRQGADRLTAWLALPFVLLGSRWWFMHATLPMSSIQSVALALIAVLVWRSHGRRSLPGSVAAGSLVALTLWCHVLCGVMALGAIAGSEAIAAWRGPAAERGRRLARLGVFAVVGAGLGAPPILTQLTIRRLNDAPHHWFAPELHDPVFALHTRAPLAALLGAVGLVLAARRWPEQGWLVVWAAIGLAGQTLGYLGHDLGWPVPWILPHEFQWHEQLVLMVAAAAAAVLAARRLVAGKPARAATLVVMLVMALGGAALDLPRAGEYLVRLDARWRDLFLMSDWIARNTPDRSVIVASPEVAYFVCNLTGRRTVTLPRGHLNPAADAAARERDLRVMLSGGDAAAFDSLAGRYGARYLLATNDVGPYDALRRRFDGWPILEPLHEQDTTGMLYLIHARPSRAASAPVREVVR